MNNNFEPTVTDVLSRETFKNAVVLAGSGGLNRKIKWTHILETKEFDKLINGNELILSTGLDLQLNSSTATYERLIEKKAAGICIERGPYFSGLSSQIKQLADENHFPIIVFEEIVKFVDITQDLHTLIINQHHQMLNQLSELTKKFTELSLAPNGILKILQQLHNSFNKKAFFLTDEAKSYYYPPEAKHLELLLQTHFKNINPVNMQPKTILFDNDSFALTPVVGLGQVWGYLCLHIDDKQTDEFLFSVLDRAALSIAQILLRNRTIEERKLNMEDKLVQNLLQGRDYEAEELQAFLPSISENLYYRIFIIQTNAPPLNMEEDWEEIKVQRSMLFRSLFKQSGFFPVVSAKKNEIAIICSFTAEDKEKKETSRLSNIIDNIFNVDEKNIIDGSSTSIGVSSVYQNISRAPIGYIEAKEVLQLQYAGLSKCFYYENIGIYQLLFKIQEDGHLESYINEHIGDLISHDHKTDAAFLKTLEIYFECNGSKKEAADRLFIVRQTLYHRLDKIELILGKDFMEPMNRISIETAIKGYLLMNSRLSKENRKLNATNLVE
ncbi:purine catabolism regulator [Virgibacillus natechei]|uniref:Purine catabolism regulator n=1 Tax=Virgibacillus natechei TaxID=1216297 RepID=A0ABS4IGH6_9BACI|nr:PucR family transcriptional regulator ligand-binding domain-containing protein [Virgibacillus natechei]MBP1970052.1 purine catabolism regulator [Virgibacillus natechei]UZD14137.1 PucR family transcriptional regulator ligand-binding domain-containing protein [Virgibacillus natechei]